MPDARTIGRLSLGGSLMGVANLVPGISGGTMLVAAGVYQLFIDAIADVSRLRFSARSIVIISVIVAAAGVAIVLLASVVAAGLASFRWGMYSLFIGLTLGGVPVLWKLIKPMTAPAWVGTGFGAAIMLALVAAQTFLGASTSRSGIVFLTLGGVAGASAMILPGVSGAYLLLLLGVYNTIITSIKDVVGAVARGDLAGAMDEVRTLLPVGIGVVVGIVLVSNVLKFVLRRFEKATLGVLLGLLVAAPAGLYPFREGVPPVIGDEFEGVVLTEETIGEVDPKDWPERAFTPVAVHLVGAAGLIGLGFLVTMGVARLGRDDPASARDAAAGSGVA